MHEPGLPASTGAGWDEHFVSAVSGVLGQFCSPDAQALAEAVLLNLNHPPWAVWLPAGGSSGTVLAPGKVMIAGSHSTARSRRVAPDLSARRSA
jgi:hypothetical protein